ncbi:MAG: hypothetical protein JWM74_2435, partial [Myxococcaceae bacterium]|nr:hypothetical protein [Myxococcaceae bacterium]
MSESRPAAGAVGTTVAWGLLVYGAVQLIASQMARNATGAAAIEAVVAEFGAGRLGISWSDPEQPMPAGAAIAKRAARGAAIGLGVAAVLVLFTVVTRAASLGSSKGSVAQVVVGVLLVALYAVRDELLLRGLVLRAFKGTAPDVVLLGLCGLSGAASRWGMSATCTPLEAAAAGALAVVFAALWLADRGAWLAWGAHVGYGIVTGPLTRGGLVDLRAQPGLWGGGDNGVEAGAAGLVVVAAAAIG